MTRLDRSNRCGIGVRGVATAIDSIVWLALLFAAVLAVGTATGESTALGLNVGLEGRPAIVAIFLWLGLGISYHALLESLFGKTIGKYLVGIRVVDSNGTAPSLGSAITRNVLRILDWFPLLYLLGIASIVFSESPRRLGDRAGGTVVVRS